ncbi:MAG: iron-only hydrogenase system regulator [Deltaproteobacteria bacterium]|jgi:putative iron-only hydrogenase system regulator|nr:iron-only hydrogenase system regulator [Deltaproteobacteria bacterium]
MTDQEETRIAIIGIIVKDKASVETLNDILHHYSDYIIGRMGVPYRSKGLNIISVAVDAPNQVINSLAGKIGKLAGVSAKAVYSSPEKPKNGNHDSDKPGLK